MEIQTDRLTLRLYTNDDFSFLVSLLSDSEVVRYIGQGDVKSEAEMKKFFDWILNTYNHNPDYGLKVISLKETGEPIGHAGLVPQTIEGVRELEVGYWIARQHWGKGYATEIAEALKNYGLEKLGQTRLISLIQPENKGSVNVARKIGMRLDRTITLKGKDVHVYAIMKH